MKTIKFLLSLLFISAFHFANAQTQILNAEPRNYQDTVRSYPNTPPPPLNNNNQSPGSTSPNNSNDNNNIGRQNPSLQNNSGSMKTTLPDTTNYRRNSSVRPINPADTINRNDPYKRDSLK